MSHHRFISFVTVGWWTGKDVCWVGKTCIGREKPCIGRVKTCIWWEFPGRTNLSCGTFLQQNGALLVWQAPNLLREQRTPFLWDGHTLRPTKVSQYFWQSCMFSFVTEWQASEVEKCYRIQPKGLQSENVHFKWLLCFSWNTCSAKEFLNAQLCLIIWGCRYIEPTKQWEDLLGAN